MKKNIFIMISLLIAWVGPVWGQSLATLQKENATLMKTIKKQYGLKKVEIRVENDGYWYFLLTDKTGQIGMATREGKVIIPVENYSIVYIPAESKGENIHKETDPVGKVLTYKYCYTNSNPGFLVEYGTFRFSGLGINNQFIQEDRHYSKFVSLDGDILIKDLKGVVKIPGYWVVSIDNQRIRRSFVLTYSGKNIGLLKANGEVLLQPEYVDLKLGSMVLNQSDDASFQQCIFSKYENKIRYAGGLALNQKAPTTPCLFYELFLCSNYGKDYKWMVQLKETNWNREYYDPNKKYIVNYRDKGEEYYSQQKFDDVIAFYAKEGISAPWAKFYTGIALERKASDCIRYAYLIVDDVEKHDLNHFYVDNYLDGTADVVDFKLSQKLRGTAILMLEQYMKEDSTFIREASISCKVAKEFLEKMPDLSKRYDSAIVVIENNKAKLMAEKKALEEQKQEKKAVIEKAELARRQEAQLQRAQVLQAFLGIFMNAITNSVSGNGRSGNVNGRGNYGTTTTVNQTTSSNSGSNASKIADWQSRKSNAERRLADYREKQRKDPNSSYLKQTIASEERIINECNDNIVRLQSGN